jgi:hypothetical protein
LQRSSPSRTSTCRAGSAPARGPAAAAAGSSCSQLCTDVSAAGASPPARRPCDPCGCAGGCRGLPAAEAGEAAAVVFGPGERAAEGAAEEERAAAAAGGCGAEAKRASAPARCGGGWAVAWADLVGVGVMVEEAAGLGLRICRDCSSACSEARALSDGRTGVDAES